MSPKKLIGTQLQLLLLIKTELPNLSNSNLHITAPNKGIAAIRKRRCNG